MNRDVVKAVAASLSNECPHHLGPKTDVAMSGVDIHGLNISTPAIKVVRTRHSVHHRQPGNGNGRVAERSHETKMTVRVLAQPRHEPRRKLIK